MKRVYKKNLPVLKFFCADATSKMDFMGTEYKKGSAYRNAKCLCKNGQNGDPWWKKSCTWSHKSNTFNASDASDIVCTSKQPNNDQLDADNAALDAQNQANAVQED